MPHTHAVFSIDRKTDTAETDKTVFHHAAHAIPGPELQNRVFYIFLPIKASLLLYAYFLLP